MQDPQQQDSTSRKCIPVPKLHGTPATPCPLLMRQDTAWNPWESVVPRTDISEGFLSPSLTFPSAPQAQGDGKDAQAMQMDIGPVVSLEDGKAANGADRGRMGRQESMPAVRRESPLHMSAGARRSRSSCLPCPSPKLADPTTRFVHLCEN